MERIIYRGLPQGVALSPLLFSTCPVNADNIINETRRVNSFVDYIKERRVKMK